MNKMELKNVKIEEITFNGDRVSNKIINFDEILNSIPPESINHIASLVEKWLEYSYKDHKEEFETVIDKKGKVSTVQKVVEDEDFN